MKKKIIPNNPDGTMMQGEKEREYIFFKITYNHFRDVSDDTAHAVRDREEWAECECVLYLPESYREDGEETPLIISCHGAGGHVCEQSNEVGGLTYVSNCLDAGYAALDVCGSELHGKTMGCPEHLAALYKAYRYVLRNYNVSSHVLVAGASMGGHVAMNFANTFPSITMALGLIFPRLNMESVVINGHTCIGTWDKLVVGSNGMTTRECIADVYRFPGSEWYEPNTIGFNPHRAHSFINAEGKRVILPPCPIKVWQGLADQVVDPVMVQEFVDSVRRAGAYIELHMLDGIKHDVTPVMQQELVMWFNRFI